MSQTKYRRPTIAIITDAGYASRFLPWSKTSPKGMLPMGNKPIMQLVVEECAKAGINDIIIVTTETGQPIYKNYFEDAAIRVQKQLRAQGKSSRYASVEEVINLPSIRIITQDQSLPYGNGSPILSAKNFIANDEAFIVCYSDDIILGSSDVSSLLDSFDRHPDADAIIMTQQVNRLEVSKYGIVSLRENGLLDNIVEKPEIGNAPSTLASYGRYLLTPKIFDFLQPNKIAKNRELWTVNAITDIAKAGNVYVEKTAGRWQTTGDPENYFLAYLEFVLKNEPYADKVRSFIANH